MARLLTCGFEENNGAQTMWFDATGGFSTSNVHSGTYAGTVTAGQSFQRRLAATKSSGTLLTRIYWQTNSLSGDGNRIMRWANSGGSTVLDQAQEPRGGDGGHHVRDDLDQYAVSYRNAAVDRQRRRGHGTASLSGRQHHTD